MNKILTNMCNDSIIAYATSNRDSSAYSFKLTRQFTPEFIRTELRHDSWNTAANRACFFVKGPLYKAAAKKELVQKVYEETLKLTGSGFTANNVPIYLFDKKEGRWQMTLPKWSTGSHAGQFHDRTHLSGLKSDYFGNYCRIWNDLVYQRTGVFTISKYATAKDLDRIIRYLHRRENTQWKQLQAILVNIINEMQGPRVGRDWELKWNDEDGWVDEATIRYPQK